MYRLILIAGLVVALVTCGVLREAAMARRPSQVDAILDAPAFPATAARLLALGFTSVAADLHFLQAIQLYGDRSFTRGTELERQRRGQALHRLLEYATDLDPQFVYAYIFGALTVPVGRMDGGMHNLDETIALLEKGRDHAGPDWRIPFYLAYQHSAFTGDFGKAAAAMQDAASRPGCPDYVPLLATRLAAQGGELETALVFARAMYDQATTDTHREEMLERIRLLEMEQDLRFLEEGARLFHARFGEYPRTVDELVMARVISAVPEDPHGGEYVIDPETGEVRSTMAFRLRLAEMSLEELEAAKAASAKTEEE